MKREFGILFTACAALITNACANVERPAPYIPGLPDPANWRSDFYWASSDAQGPAWCESDPGEEFDDRFRRRFGPRFERLEEGYEEFYGDAPWPIIVGGCAVVTERALRRARVEQRDSFARFDGWLTAAEKQLEEARAAAAQSQQARSVE